MQPNSPQPVQPLDASYLDTIAARQTVKTVSPIMLWGLIGGLLVIIAAVVIGVSSSSGISSASLASVGATLSNLQSTSETAQDDIKSGELRSLNSSLTLTLTNTNRDFAEQLKTQKINIKNTKSDKSLLAIQKTFDDMKTRLEDARLNALYDRTYAREITYELKTLHTNMGQLYKSTRSTSLKSILNKADTGLSLLLEGFQNFNDS